MSPLLCFVLFGWTWPDWVQVCKDLVVAFLKMLNDWWNGLVAWISTHAMDLINTALTSLPSGWQTSVETVRSWLEVANSWVPLDYCFQLWIGYLTWTAIWWFMGVVASLVGVRAAT